MSFWVYENWQAGPHRAVIHAGSCGFCKEGLGRSGHGTDPAYGRWLGPFNSQDEAVARAESFKRLELTIHRCCGEAARTRPAQTVAASTHRVFAPPAIPAEEFADSEFLLLGCTATKLDYPAKAKDLYRSPRFLKRRAYAEASGKPWAIISAKYGLVPPETEIAPYDLSLESLTPEQRVKWGERVVTQLQDQLGPLEGRVFELLASRLYGDPLEPSLAKSGARLVRPLRHVTLYQEPGWYDTRLAALRASVAASASVHRTSPDLATGLALALTKAFMAGELDLSQRPETPPVGWQGVPEVPAAERLRKAGATNADVRYFLTLTTALDRARDANRLWSCATELFLSEPWAFDPAAVLENKAALPSLLAQSGVSQRHGPDSEAWLTIAETLSDPTRLPTVWRAINEGEGDAAELLKERMAASHGRPLLPMIRGPKIGPLWVRMLAHPGGATLSSLATLPVAVDVQVRRATESLGLTATVGMDLEQARPTIQQAWTKNVAQHGAAGPGLLAGTCAALDPALWFFGKYGCNYCESVAAKTPIAAVCSHCQAFA